MSKELTRNQIETIVIKCILYLTLHGLYLTYNFVTNYHYKLFCRLRTIVFVLVSFTGNSLVIHFSIINNPKIFFLSLALKNTIFLLQEIET